MSAAIPRSTTSVAIRGRRPTTAAMWERREVMAPDSTQTQSKNQLSLKLDGVLYSARWPASGNARSARPASPSATRACGCSPSRASPARRSTRSPRRPTSPARRSSPTSRPRRRSSSATASAAIDGLAPALRERPGDETTIARRPRLARRAHGLARARARPAAALVREVPDRRRPPAAALRRGRTRHRRGVRGRARPGPGARRRAGRSLAGRGPPSSGGDRGRTDAGGGSDALARRGDRAPRWCCGLRRGRDRGARVLRSGDANLIRLIVRLTDCRPACDEDRAAMKGGPHAALRHRPAQRLDVS